MTEVFYGFVEEQEECPLSDDARALLSDDVGCSSDSVFETVSEHCNDEENCTIAIQQASLDDEACPTVTKYFYAIYTCSGRFL